MARKAKFLLINIHEYVPDCNKYTTQTGLDSPLRSSYSLDHSALALQAVFMVPWARSPRVNKISIFATTKIIIGGYSPPSPPLPPPMLVKTYVNRIQQVTSTCDRVLLQY